MQVEQTRFQKVGHKYVPFDKVQWSQFPEEWATWENLNTLEQHFPSIVG
jgi:hypothetical protein